MSLLSKCIQRLIISSAGVSVGNVITPVQTEVFRTEGDNITLSCNYSSAISLQWSRQYPNSAPEYLLVILHGTGQVSQKSKLVDQDPRFNGKLNEKKTQVIMEISSAKLTLCSVLLCPDAHSDRKTLHTYKNPTDLK